MNALMTVQVPEFTAMINAKMKAMGIGRNEAFKVEARLLAGELIQRTPPFSGKSIVKMLGVQGMKLSQSNSEVQGLSAYKVGLRRVAKDIGRWLMGMKNMENQNMGDVFVSQNTRPDRGQNAEAARKATRSVIQKVKGKDVARVFTDKNGRVYGVDVEMYRQNPTIGDLEKMHTANRDRRGRGKKIPSTGIGTAIGRWTFINKLVVPQKFAAAYIKRVQGMVGQGKGGWAKAFMQLGGRMSSSGWVGKHAARAGAVKTNFTPDKTAIEIINRSQWARGGDEGRIIDSALRMRAESLKQAIKRHMTDTWGKGGKI